MPSWVKRFVQIVAISIIGTGAALASTPGLLFGQQHAYSVTMRGNGEAVVTARIAVTNQSDTAQKTFAFEIPGLQISQLIGYQQHLADTCLEYGYSQAPDASGTLTRPCAKSVPPDYSVNSYYTGASYAKLTLQSDGHGKYHTELPTALEPGKSTALILAYSGTGYATKQVTGAYNFKFQTIKVGERIENLTVAVDVDADQYLDGGKATVGYNAGSAKPALAAGASAATSAQLDSIAAGVGTGGQISKTAKDLAAGESFAVKGTYADALWKLHPWRLVLSLGLALLVLGFIMWAVLRMRRRHHDQPAPVHHDNPATDARAGSHINVLDPATIITGFASALVITLVIWSWAAYGDQLDTSDTFTMTITGILLVLGCALILLGPIIGLALRRRDWRVAAYVVVWQFVWLIAFLLIYHLAFRPMQPNGGPIITPYSSVQDQGAATK